MTHLLICTALGVEARALRRGLPGDLRDVTVVRTGMGPERAQRTVALLPAFSALAVAGFGGALDDGLKPGDVLVASDIRFGDRVLPCPAAGLLAEELTRAGIRARFGPLVTSDHVVTGPERRWLAGTGARAVDMEAGPLAIAAGGRPFVAARVIVDTPDHPLAGPATLRGGIAARRTLRRLSPFLMRWAPAATARRTTTWEVRP